ncbi:DUF881 domain-containing protein [Micromonospora siamensis]|uniref:Uncharacterized conserved protein YlxW, UPF0749 family n=1 Tax=Micromonospora siamensis TaxID=299152 RepID=A0A1C5IK68_9ACTN|nr:DUF881 domain-containing protein [Micromonospora siamensis]SCG58379.1 Uncharacterized conserved protein YlxW, UPF0749 family [Micromonospora siamensis]
MSEDERSGTGTGWPEPVEPARPEGPAGEPDPRPEAPDADELSPLAPVEPAGPVERPVDDGPSDGQPTEAAAAGGAGAAGGGRGRVSGASVMIAALLALLGFTLVVQLRTTSTDPAAGATRQEDLVRILSDLGQRETRLRQDIAALEDSQRQLRSGEQGRKAALEEATRRADELGILAGTLPATGPGLTVSFEPGTGQITANRVLDAVQELRGAGAEAMQISGAGGTPARIVASTYFLDGENGGLVVDGRRLSGPFTITVIGDPATMRTALNIPGGVVASVQGGGGNVIVEDRGTVEVSALHDPLKLEHARPVS